MVRLLVVLLFIVLLASGILRFAGGRRAAAAPASRAPAFPYRRRKTLFTPAERSFLGVLDREALGRYRVFGKVALADLVEVSGAPSRSHRSAAFNRIAQKHVDFVLCKPDDLAVVAAIELNDASHAHGDRQARDAFIAGACRAAGLPLLRFPAKASYTTAEVRAALLTLEEPIEVMGPDGGGFG